MGGKWIIRLRKGLASRCWENLILAMLGEQFMVGEEICGAVVSVRFQVKLTNRPTPVFTSKHVPPSVHSHMPSLLLVSRRTSSPSGTKLLVTRRPLPASETPCAESSTCLPTPSWSTRLTQTALSMYVSSFYYFLFNLSISHTNVGIAHKIFSPRRHCGIIPKLQCMNVASTVNFYKTVLMVLMI